MWETVSPHGRRALRVEWAADRRRESRDGILADLRSFPQRRQRDVLEVRKVLIHLLEIDNGSDPARL